MSNEIEQGKKAGSDDLKMLVWGEPEKFIKHAAFGIVDGASSGFDPEVGDAIGGLVIHGNPHGAFTLTKRNAPAIIAELQRLLGVPSVQVFTEHEDFYEAASESQYLVLDGDGAAWLVHASESGDWFGVRPYSEADPKRAQADEYRPVGPMHLDYAPAPLTVLAVDALRA